MKRRNGEGGAEVETKKVRMISGRVFLSQRRDWLGDFEWLFQPQALIYTPFHFLRCR